jgi:poly-gamma-glutamate synthesis protein (capsule biosynthesis protein)
MKILLSFFFCFFLSSTFAQDTTRLSLLFAGDIMGHDSQIASAYETTKEDLRLFFLLQVCKAVCRIPLTVAIGNLELTLAGPPYTGYPQFGSPDALGTTLKDMGFDVLVTANNHCVDRGRKGLERTIMMLDSFKIAHTGTFVDSLARVNKSPLIVEKNGFKLAILNYTYGTNGIPVTAPNIVNHLDTAVMRKDLLEAKEARPDAIIVFTHWGLEYESLPAKKEKDLTEFCFKHGAQMVIGSHPSRSATHGMEEGQKSICCLFAGKLHFRTT